MISTTGFKHAKGKELKSHHSDLAKASAAETAEVVALAPDGTWLLP